MQFFVKVFRSQIRAYENLLQDLQFDVRGLFFDEHFSEEILFQERPLEDTGCMFSRIKAVDRRFIECGCNGTNFWNLKSISQETFVPRHRQLNQPTEISKSYKKPSFRHSI